MASGQNEKSAGVAIGQVEMDAKRQQPSKRRLAGFGDSDAARGDAMLPVAIQADRQHAILVNGNCPVGDSLLVKVGGIDGKSVGFQNSRREVGDFAGCQLGTEVGNREEQMSSGKDDARRMLGRAQESFRLEQGQQSSALCVVDRAGNSHEVSVRPWTPLQS